MGQATDKHTCVCSHSYNKVLQLSLCKYSLLRTCSLIPQRSLIVVKCSDLQGTNIEPWQKEVDTFLANQRY